MDSIEYEIETEYEIFYTIEPGCRAEKDFTGMEISPAEPEEIDIVGIKLFGETLSHKQHMALLDKYREEIEDKIMGVEIIRAEDAEVEKCRRERF